MTDKTKNRRIKWILGGFRALAAGGVGAIRVEPIAREIGVSKGGFYWDFKDLSDFKSAMLDYYCQIGTEQIIKLSTRYENASEQLLFIIRAATTPPPENVGGKSAEVAVRDWARWDEKARDKIAQIDNIRVKSLFDILCQMGLDKEKALNEAQTMYALYLGAINLRCLGHDWPNNLALEQYALKIINQIPPLNAPAPLQ